jgi:cell wall-associated NlpC family hydrolase
MCALLVAATSLVSATTTIAGAQTGPPRPADAVGPAVDALRVAVDAVVAAEIAKAEGEQRLVLRRQEEDLARTRLRVADAAVEEQRSLYGALGAASYRRHGVSSTRDHHVMIGALNARKVVLDAALGEQEAADAAYRAALAAREAEDRAVAAAEAARATAEQARATAEADADAALVAAGATDLPSVAYLAYQRAADDANAADPDCRLPAAVLAGYGRLHWTHGRPSPTAVQVAPAKPPAGDPEGPYDLDAATRPVAEALCADTGPLDKYLPLQKALFDIERDSARVRIVLATARRYSRIPGLQLGTVPLDPYAAADGVPQFDDGAPPLAAGDVQGMIDWAMTRLGTPYSQCLGVEARPQDPECPPGTNRFGAGFFDCSGFVSYAYRRIGVTIPTTTYAMESDPGFMATRVATGFDLAVLQPGDVFLMDGHTGMYVGGGQIIHASGGGLTLEPIPRWVAHATFAILRPLGAVPPPR